MSGPNDEHQGGAATREAPDDAEFSEIPKPTPVAGRRALSAILRERSVLSALSIFHEELGDVFQISAGSFRPVFMVGPEAAHFVLITARDQLLWRPEGDPVAELLRDGLLMTDGEKHDTLRRRMNPALHRRMLGGYVDAMIESTDRIMAGWSAEEGPVEMLEEMRRIALLIVMDCLFRVDMMPDLDRMLPAILDTLRYISPGLWTVWPGAPRFGYASSLQEMDDYLYGLIRARRAGSPEGDDVLGILVNTPDMSDDLIRDQMLTLLIAGHDTSTALLAWTLYLLGRHPQAARKVLAEVDRVLGKEAPTLEHTSELKYMEQVVNESMRLYPPIHIGNRVAATDLTFQNYRIPAGTRVVYSIYLTHRHPGYWPDPDRFDPERFSDEENRKRVPYTYLPFGGGPRNCIGAAFAQVEVKVVLSRILQTYELSLDRDNVRPRMGATLEPSPGVMMRVRRRG